MRLQRGFPAIELFQAGWRGAMPAVLLILPAAAPVLLPDHEKTDRIKIPLRY
jgi:hypothetical protein